MRKWLFVFLGIVCVIAIELAVRTRVTSITGEPAPELHQNDVISEIPDEHDESEGPLDQFARRIWGVPVWGADPADASPSDMQNRLDWEHRWTEEYIAACMLEKGFEYTLDLENAPQVVLPDGPLRGTREFAEQYGFGLSNGMRYSGAITTIGFANTANDSRLAAMSAAEAEAWNWAFWGNTRVEFLPDGTERDYGCQGAAHSALMAGDDTPFSPLLDEINRFGERVAADPAMVALDLEWSACMVNLGYPGHQNPDSLFWTMVDEWAAIGPTEDVMATWDWEADPNGPPGFTLGEDGTWQLPGADSEVVLAFTEREIALATADFACQEQVDYETRAHQINLNLQAEFVGQHQDELEEWAAYAEARRVR